MKFQIHGTSTQAVFFSLLLLLNTEFLAHSIILQRIRISTKRRWERKLLEGLQFFTENYDWRFLSLNYKYKVFLEYQTVSIIRNRITTVKTIK